MKKVLSILFAVAILCMGIIPSYAANPQISVSTVSSAAVGDTITVAVNLSANSGLAGINFTVKFNTTEFTLVSDSVNTNSLFVGDKNIGNDSIKYAGVSSDAVKSGGTLLSFKLKVLKTGGKISLSLNDAIDENDNFVKVSSSGATVNCSHAQMKWTVTKNATCAEKGEKKGACTCGYTKTEAIAKTQHSYGAWVVEKEATEAQNGLKVSKCSVCGDRREQTIPAIVTTTKPASNTTTTTKPSMVITTTPSSTTTTTRPSMVTTTAPSSTTTTTKPSTVTTTTKPNENLSVETTTELITETTTKIEEPTTETTTFVENTTESTTKESTTAPSVEIVEKTSTSKIVATTIFAVLGIEVIVGLIVFLVIKNKKKK